MQEECAEIIQSISKINRFGLNGKNPLTNEYNSSNLTMEVGDILAMVDLAIENGLLDRNDIMLAKNDKLTRLKQWSTIFS